MLTKELVEPYSCENIILFNINELTKIEWIDWEAIKNSITGKNRFFFEIVLIRMFEHIIYLQALNPNFSCPIFVCVKYSQYSIYCDTKCDTKFMCACLEAF